MPTITIDNNTRLVRTDKFAADTVFYAVVQHGWEIGEFVEVPADATPAQVVEAYMS